MSYTQTIITPAPDCKAPTATLPPEKTPPTKAQIEYDLLSAEPATHDHDSFNYTVYATQCGHKGTAPEPREQWLSKGRPCMRASPLTKTYGWHAYYDAAAKITLLDNNAAATLIDTAGVATRPAMRNKKA